MLNTLDNAAEPRALHSHSLFTEARYSDLPNYQPSVRAWDTANLDDLAIGLMAFELEDYSVATSVLMRIGDEDPAQFAIAQECLGVAHLKTGHPELAIEPLRRAVQLDERLHRDPLAIAECQFSLGLAYARTGHDECALSEYRDALRCEPHWGSVLYEIARVHAHRNRVVDSVAYLADAARQDELFLDRAEHDFDFDTVRRTPEFSRLLPDS